MKIIIRIFLWLSMIFNGIISLGILIMFWGPLYLAIEKGERYNWFLLIGTFFAAFIGFIISLIIYKHLINQRPIILKRNKIILIILFIIYLGLSLTFNPEIIWLHIIFALGLGIVFVTYPKLIKKYG